MKLTWKKILNTAFIPLLCIGLIGCSSGDDSDTDVGGTGTSTISGSVVALNRDIEQVGDSSAEARQFSNSIISETSTDTSPLDKATVRLYSLDENGERVYTTFKTTTDENGDYSFSNVTKGKLYVAEAIKVGINHINQPKRIVQAGIVDTSNPNSATFQSDLSPVSGLILDVIIDKVIEAAQTEESLNVALTIAIIQDVLEDQIASGETTLVSHVQEYDPENDLGQEDPEDTDTVVSAHSLSAEQKAEADKLKSDKNVQSATIASELNAKLNNEKELTDEEREDFIREVFTLAYDSSGMPEFFIKSFAKVLKDGKTFTIDTLATAINESIYSEWVQLKTVHKTAAIISAGMLEAVNGNDSKIKELYAHYIALETAEAAYNAALAAGEDTTTVKANLKAARLALADVPPLAQAIFPNDATKWALPITSSQTMTLPQALLVMSLADELKGEESLTEAYLATDEAEDLDNSHDSYFDPVTFMLDAGMVAEADLAAEPLILFDKHAATVTVHVPGQTNENGYREWTQVEALHARIEAYSQQSDFDIAKVQLRYRKTGDAADEQTGLVQLTKRVRNNDSEDENDGNDVGETQDDVSVSVARMNTMRVQARLAALQNSPEAQDKPTQESWELNPWYQGDDEPAPVVVTDYLSGAAKIELIDSNNDVILFEDVMIYKVDGIGRLSLLSPRGRDNDYILNGRDEADKRTVFTLEDGDNKLDSLRLDWTAGDTSQLPAELELVYSIWVELSAFPITWDQPTDFSKLAMDEESWDNLEGNGYGYKHIYDSWRTGHATESSIEIQGDFFATEFNTEANLQTMYRVYVKPMAVIKETDREVWEGEQTYAEFFIADSTFIQNISDSGHSEIKINSGWKLALEGSVTFGADMDDFVPLTDGSIAAFKADTSNILDATDEAALIAGTWKLGVYEVHGPKAGNANQFEPKFHTNADGPRRPAQNDDGSIVLITELGSTADVSDASIDFTLPTITNDSGVLKKDTEYAFVVHFDQTGAPDDNTRPDWDKYITGSRTEPVDDAIDFVDFHVLETAFNAYHHLYVGHDRVDYNYHSESNGIYSNHHGMISVPTDDDGNEDENAPEPPSVDFEVGEKQLFF